MMNRDQLLGGLPNGQVFNAMAPYQRKGVAEDLVGAILDAIEAEHREPDAWESIDLAAAIGYIACHWHHAALAACDHALTPPADRAPLNSNVAVPHPLRDLRDAHLYVAAMPARAV